MTETELQRALAPMVAQLTRIATALESLQPVESMPEQESPTCLHPLETRTDFGMTNGQPEWQCQLCGYRTVNL